MALSLQWLWGLLWHGMDPWPGNFHMLHSQKKKKKKKFSSFCHLPIKVPTSIRHSFAFADPSRNFSATLHSELHSGHSELILFPSLSIFYISSSHERNICQVLSAIFFPCPKPVFLFLIGGMKAGLSDSWIDLNRSQPIMGPYNK